MNTKLFLVLALLSGASLSASLPDAGDGRGGFGDKTWGASQYQAGGGRGSFGVQPRGGTQGWGETQVDPADQVVVEACHPIVADTAAEAARELLNRVRRISRALKVNNLGKANRFLDKLPDLIRPFDTPLYNQVVEGNALQQVLEDDRARNPTIGTFYDNVIGTLLLQKHGRLPVSPLDDELDSDDESDQSSERTQQSARIYGRGKVAYDRRKIGYFVAAGTTGLAVLGLLYFILGGSSKKSGKTVVYPE